MGRAIGSRALLKHAPRPHGYEVAVPVNLVDHLWSANQEFSGASFPALFALSLQL